MYNTFAQSEAEFASAYLTYKLQRGGVPSVSQKELTGAALGLALTEDNGQRFPKLTKLNFQNLPAVAADLQSRIAVENDGAAIKGVICRDDNLLPTYDFQDVGDVRHAQPLTNLLKRHDFATAAEVKLGGKISPKYQLNATVAAQYLTDCLMEKYVENAKQHGRVSSLTRNVNNLFDRGKADATAVDDDTALFNRFKKIATRYLGSLMTANGGVAKISNQYAGNLAYNNWCRLLAGFPDLRRYICDVDINSKEFMLTLTPESVQVEERQFVPHLVAQDQVDGYRHTQIDLLAKYNQATPKLHHCQVGNSQLAREVNERLRPW